MTVSKRLRYEILRRDNHTCRYCGGTAPSAALTIDHVLPAALGGSDEPTNLVAACADCNASKSASNPGEPLLDQVAEDAIRWAKAVEVAAQQASAKFGTILHNRDAFLATWHNWEYLNAQRKPEHFPLPGNWPSTIDCLRARGLPSELIAESVRITMTRQGVKIRERFKYFCGVAWTKVREIDKSASSIRDAKTGADNERIEVGAGLYAGRAEEIVTRITEALSDRWWAGAAAKTAFWAALEAAHREYVAQKRAGVDDDGADELAADKLGVVIAEHLDTLSPLKIAGR